MTTHQTPDAFLDALTFARRTLREDWTGRTAVARGCDPVAMVDALTDLYLGLILQSVGPSRARVDAYLDYLREHLPELIEGNE